LILDTDECQYAPAGNVDAIVTAADFLMYQIKKSDKGGMRVEPFSSKDPSHPVDPVAISASISR
jgi:hypothetical protein